jgi:hypothetical protein
LDCGLNALAAVERSRISHFFPTPRKKRFVFCHFQIPAAQQTKSLSDHLAVWILSLEAASASLLKKGREIP